MNLFGVFFLILGIGMLISAMAYVSCFKKVSLTEAMILGLLGVSLVFLGAFCFLKTQNVDENNYNNTSQVVAEAPENQTETF